MDFSHYATPDPEFAILLEQMGGPAALQLPKGLSPIELRATINAQRVQFSQEIVAKLPKVVTSRDIAVKASDGHDIPVRIYSHKEISVNEPQAVFYYAHGGGFLFGSLDTEDAFCSRLVIGLLAAGCPTTVVSVDYRHTPEAVFPTQVHDTWEAFDYIANHASDILRFTPTKFVVGGISAGGSLASAITLRELEAGTKRIGGAWLCIPSCCASSKLPREKFAPGIKLSPEQCADAPLLSQDTMTLFNTMYVPDASQAGHKWLSPVLLDTKELVGHPKTVFQIAGWDPLRDGALLYAELLKEAGSDVQVEVYQGLPHAWWRFPELKSSKKYGEDTIKYLKSLLE